MRRSHRRRRNPTGTLLVNSGRKGGKSRRRARRNGSSLGRFLAKHNPGRGSVNVRGYTRKRPTRRSKSRGRKRNPLMVNGRHSKSRRSHSRRRRNPIVIGRHNPRRHNPSGPRSMLKRYRKGAQNMLRKVPLIGGLLASAVGTLGGVLGGALGVYPTAYVMPHVAKYVPDWLKPFGYSVAGAILSAAIKMLPVKLPYKEQLAIGVAAAGGAVDAYRMRLGKSDDLGEDDLDSLLAGEDGDYGDLGADEIGNEGGALSAIEFADADLGDADYCGEDLSADEMAAIELGRKHYWRKYGPGKGERAGRSTSGHAGKPGLRWGWLIYWIGHDNFKKLTQLDAAERRQWIAKARHEAKLRATKLLTEGADTSVQQAEMSGLLVAA